MESRVVGNYDAIRNDANRLQTRNISNEGSRSGADQVYPWLGSTRFVSSGPLGVTNLSLGTTQQESSRAQLAHGSRTLAESSWLKQAAAVETAVTCHG